MGTLGQDYVDLIASGDRQKISCVLLAAGATAGISGIAAGVVFAPANAIPVAGQAMNATAAGIGAVLGALMAARTAYNVCGGESTRGSFDALFKNGKIDSITLNDYESLLKREFNVSADEARLLSKAAYVYSDTTTLDPMPNVTSVEKKNAVALLLKKLVDSGLS